MKVKQGTILLVMVMLLVAFTGCGNSSDQVTEEAKDGLEAVAETVEVEEAVQASLADGVYSADFNTDSGMFHANEAHEGKGILTVENGEMTLHVSLASKSILNLFCGTAEDAQQDGAVLLEPSTDSVTYSDGLTEEVYGFDIPVPGIDQEFALALIGKKGKWYDHTVSVSNPLPIE
ncbi:MAG: hypothetical protein JXO44_05185 [Clostridia bacterium]|nr:hypothetical protein [Clostridia bacterium]